MGTGAKRGLKFKLITILRKIEQHFKKLLNVSWILTDLYFMAVLTK